MLSEKIHQATSDALARLEEMRRSGTPPERIWGGRNFVQREGEFEYEIDIKVRLRK